MSRLIVSSVGPVDVEAPAAAPGWSQKSLLSMGPEFSSDAAGCSFSGQAIRGDTTGPYTNLCFDVSWRRVRSFFNRIVFDAVPRGIINLPADQLTVNALSFCQRSPHGPFRFSGNVSHAYHCGTNSSLSLTYGF